MISEIKCGSCGAVIGTLSKVSISEQDILEYQQMVTCPNGHSGENIELIEQQGE